MRPGANVECQNGQCIIPPDACEEGYGHCSAFWIEGCEADLHRSNTCGSCDTHCYGSTPACTLGADGWQCSDGCSGETPDLCNSPCTDFQTDVNNCGARWNDCETHVLAECVDGECQPLGPCEPQYGDRTDEPGCETQLTGPEHCGACGRDDCGAANAVVECSSVSGTSVDCEANGTACFPDALAPITTRQSMGAGANVYVGGRLIESLDLDPGAGTDERLSYFPGGSGGFSVGLSLDGAYRNAHVFRGEPEAIHETPGGGSLIHLLDYVPPDGRPNLVAYYSDGTPQWALLTPGTYAALTVSTTHFALWGVEEQGSQGPLGSDERGFTSGDPVIVRRYAF